MKELKDLSMGESNAPVISLPRLAKAWGIKNIWAKAEYLNPTGSYKDRIALATMAVAIKDGRRGWLGTSSGNGGAAMSAYGARAGLPGILCVMASAPVEKLLSIKPYGALMLTMKSLGPQEMQTLAEIAQQENLILTITAYKFNPEGMKGAESIGTEIASHNRATHVYIPSGGGGLLVATANGLAAGSSKAAVICAQPFDCSPISQCINGEIATPIVDSCTTLISGLQLASPPDGDVAVERVKSSKGWGVKVRDEDTWKIQDLLATQEGVFVEPASALALAALHQDIVEGKIDSDDQPLIVLTGSGLKDLGRYRNSVGSHQRNCEIEEVKSAVQSHLATIGEGK